MPINSVNNGEVLLNKIMIPTTLAALCSRAYEDVQTKKHGESEPARDFSGIGQGCDQNIKSVR